MTTKQQEYLKTAGLFGLTFVGVVAVGLVVKRIFPITVTIRKERELALLHEELVMYEMAARLDDSIPADEYADTLDLKARFINVVRESIL